MYRRLLVCAVELLMLLGLLARCVGILQINDLHFRLRNGILVLRVLSVHIDLLGSSLFKVHILLGFLIAIVRLP